MTAVAARIPVPPDEGIEVDAAPVRPLYTFVTLAALLDVTPGTVRQMRHAGQLPPAVKVGSRVRWRPETIDRWLAEQEEGDQ